MVTIGIRELKQQTSKILRRVREDGETIEITYYGKAVAHLIPINPPTITTKEMDAVLDDIHQLSIEISTKWPSNISTQDAIEDVRREW